MFYLISNWVIVAALVLFVCSRMVSDSYALILFGMLVIKILPIAVAITGVLGTGIALYMHEWKPLIYGLLWGIPTAVVLTIVGIKGNFFR